MISNWRTVSFGGVRFDDTGASGPRALPAGKLKKIMMVLINGRLYCFEEVLTIEKAYFKNLLGVKAATAEMGTQPTSLS